MSNTGSNPLRTNNLPSRRLTKSEIGPGRSVASAALVGAASAEIGPTEGEPAELDVSAAGAAFGVATNGGTPAFAALVSAIFAGGGPLALSGACSTFAPRVSSAGRNATGPSPWVKRRKRAAAAADPPASLDGPLCMAIPPAPSFAAPAGAALASGAGVFRTGAFGSESGAAGSDDFRLSWSR